MTKVSKSHFVPPDLVYPKRRKTSICRLCSNLSFRVEGPQCFLCGLKYAEEPVTKPDFTSGLGSWVFQG